MSVKDQIKKYIDGHAEPKRGEMQRLHDTILQSGMEVGAREQMAIIQELADSLR